MLKKLWPSVRKALEFCWIEGGWDADRDGVMEGCQHNTMDIEYFGPNPQITIWYLGALIATEKMAHYLGEGKFAQTCRELFERGSAWVDKNLFNGEYYEQQIWPTEDSSQIPECLVVGGHSKDLSNPAYQLGSGCLIDQLVGQCMAHICNLGYLLKPSNIHQTLRSIMKYNYRKDLHNHFNCFRCYALADESALLMADYPKGRPQIPFPYFTETMTGFEYIAAVGMLYEGIDDGLKCIKNIRDRYDGKKRNPFDEAECGHHYVRAMASWASVLALTGFSYSGIEKSMAFAAKEGRYFWSNGYSWGRVFLKKTRNGIKVELSLLYGELNLSNFVLRDFGFMKFNNPLRLKANKKAIFNVNKSV